jgi:hypothetical protein
MGTTDKRFMQKGSVKGRLPEVEYPLEVHSFCQVAGHRPEMTVRAENMAALLVSFTAAETCKHQNKHDGRDDKDWMSGFR